MIGDPAAATRVWVPLRFLPIGMTSSALAPGRRSGNEALAQVHALSLHPAARPPAGIRLRLSARPHLRVQLQENPRHRRSLGRLGELPADPASGPVLGI